MARKDKEANRQYGREHYRANKDYYARKRREAQERNRKLLRDYKMGQRCARCDFSGSPAALEFHHPNRDGSGRWISALGNSGYSWDRILAEIAGCELICANCHRIEHAGD